MTSTSSSSEEEFELNYLKIDTKNDIRLLGKEDFEMETISFMSVISIFAEEKIGKNVSSFLKKIIPETTDILKANQEYSKQFLKIINTDKKGYYSSVNHILATNYKEQFIFNKTNLQDVCYILTYAFNEMKKYKINTGKDFKNIISQIKFEKYDFFKIYANYEYLKNRDKDKNDQTLSRGSSQCKSTNYSSYSTQVKDLYEEPSEYDESNLLDLNKYHNEARGIYYIDNKIKCSSMLSNNCNNNEEEELKKFLTKECFIYPKYNKNTISEQPELPIEFILILDKLKNVKTLIFQIQNVNDLFIKMAIFVLINIKWLFSKGIEEVKYDLGNDELQQGLCELFNERTIELYHYFHKTKNLVYYNGSYQARTINCWEPEGDIFIEKYEKNNDKTINDDKKMDYSYSWQQNEDTSTFDNHLCNIYNEFGKLTNLKYIKPFNYTVKNKIGEFQFEQKVDDFDDYNYEPLNATVVEPQKQEKEIITTNTIFNSKSTNIQNCIQNLNNSITNNTSKKSTLKLLNQFVMNKRAYFQMILIYSHFFTKSLKKIKKISLYFHTPFSYEIALLYNMKLNFDLTHFLIFTNQIETLTEANFSFNSLDDKSFEYILGLINKNTNISTLRLSFFSPEINYFDNSLFNLIYSKKISLTKLFQEQREFEIKNSQCKEKKMNNFILNEKLLNSFGNNLCNLFNLLKVISLNNIEELVMRFDIPLPLLDNNKYIILIIKFIINILIMLTFQDNKVHTLKLLAPYLEVNGNNMPYIRQLFKEMLLKDEIEVNMNNKSEINKKKTFRKKELKVQREKENALKEKKKELKEKHERKEILEKISKKDISKSLKETNNEKNNDKDDDDDYDLDKNIENNEIKRCNSLVQKKQLEQAARVEETIQIEEISIKKRSELNKNFFLENLVLQFQINNLPEIFNFCLMNNLSGLKLINLGILDEITFKGFMNSYKNNYNKLTSLTSLKITLGESVTSYANLEKYIFEYINLNSPNIQEKYLFTDLQIIYDNKMKELVDLVYVDAVVPKLVVEISNTNTHILSKILMKFIEEKKEKCREEMNSMIILMNMPQFVKLYNQIILECLSSFYGMKKNRAIICKESTISTSF